MKNASKRKQKRGRAKLPRAAASMKGTTKKRRGSTRDITQLPEDIIHHVLSYLETKKAAQSSLFCKIWYNAWLTCPTLKFDDNWRHDSKNLQFIERTLQRYQDHKIYIEQLNLSFQFFDSCLVSHVDNWIRISVQNGVQRLKLYGVGYTLPSIIFESKSLRELRVEHSTMIKPVDNKVTFNHLQKLTLFYVSIDDDMFQGIISRCPLIENLMVDKCILLKKIRVINLYNLIKFSVWARFNQDVEIEAPNLQYLNCHLENGSLKLCKAEKLRYFEFVGLLPSPTFLDDFGDKFSQVEDLRLTSLGDHSRINISSHSLNHIMLHPTNKSIEVNIDAPNMVSLELDNIEFFSDLSLANAPSQLMLNMRTSGCGLKANELCKLNRLLANVIQSKTSLVLSLPGCRCGIVSVENISICPVENEDLHLVSTLSNFLDALFLICHPKAIIVEWCPNFPDLLYKNLTERRNRELKEVKIEIYDETKHQWQPNDRKSLLDAPRQWQIVCFWLEWETTLA